MIENKEQCDKLLGRIKSTHKDHLELVTYIDRLQTRVASLEIQYDLLIKRDTRNLQDLIAAKAQIKAVELLPEKWRENERTADDADNIIVWHLSADECADDLEETLKANQ